MKIMDEVKKQIYTAANEYAAGHLDAIHISRHHFVSGVFWALGNNDIIIGNNDIINRIKSDYEFILKLYRKFENDEDHYFVDELRLELVHIQNILRQFGVQFH